MAIVKEYKTAKGVTIKFNDAAYTNKSEEERQKLREEVNKTISAILQRRR